MTGKKSARHAVKTRGAAKTRWGRVALVWVLALGAAFYVTPREKLPAAVKNNPAVIAAYELKSSWLDGNDKRAANIEPAAGTGYKTDDRRELDSLISRGRYN